MVQQYVVRRRRIVAPSESDDQSESDDHRFSSCARIGPASFAWGFSAIIRIESDVGMVGNVCFLCWFGLAQSYSSAVGFRLAQGLASGNIPVIKTYIADITDTTNDSRAFAYVGIVFGTGVILGPEFGGLLVNPAESYPNVFGSSEFLQTYPYFLPVGVIAGKIAIDLLLAVKFLPESSLFALLEGLLVFAMSTTNQFTPWPWRVPSCL